MAVRVVSLNAREMMRRQYHLENIILLEFFLLHLLQLREEATDGSSIVVVVFVCVTWANKTPSPKIERLQVYMMDYDYAS